MMSFSIINQVDFFLFFLVLTRFFCFFLILPFFGDFFIPFYIRIIFSFIVSILFFNLLKNSNNFIFKDYQSVHFFFNRIFIAVCCEIFSALLIGFSAKFIFEGINFGSNLIANFMGFSMASFYDPHQESHIEVISQIQTKLATLLFLLMNGHHLMIRGIIKSFFYIKIGYFHYSEKLLEQIVLMSSKVFSFGLELAAPMAISLFSVNLIFGILSKMIPQLNILFFSMSVTGLMGLLIMFFGVSGFYNLNISIFANTEEWMSQISKIIGLEN